MSFRWNVRLPSPLSASVAIDRTSKVAATAILDKLVEAIPCAIESLFTERDHHGIEHRLTKPKYPRRMVKPRVKPRVRRWHSQVAALALARIGCRNSYSGRHHASHDLGPFVGVKLAFPNIVFPSEARAIRKHFLYAENVSLRRNCVTPTSPVRTKDNLHGGGLLSAPYRAP